MITAVDTNVLLDVFGADPSFGPRSADALRKCLREGRLIACEVVWAEVRASFEDDGSFRATVAPLGLQLVPTSEEAALLAGRLWRAWRRSGGSRRQRVMADFLVGAHATLEADAFLTRDRGFSRKWFPDLVVVDPSRG